MRDSACERIFYFADHAYSYLIHSPFFSDKKEDHQAKWKQMEELQAQGLTKSIGVSNYLQEHLDWILETAKVTPALNQIEFHPYLQHVELLKYHKEKVKLSQPGSLSCSPLCLLIMTGH